jgi:hypothetical protein
MAGTNQVSQQVAATLPYATPATLAMLLRSRSSLRRFMYCLEEKL